jgi:hypothetical protein
MNSQNSFLVPSSDSIELVDMQLFTDRQLADRAFFGDHMTYLSLCCVIACAANPSGLALGYASGLSWLLVLV